MKGPIYYWQKEAETYFSSTPSPKTWFEFLTWITSLATLKFLDDRTTSPLITVIYFFSYATFFNYIHKILWTIKFQNFFPKRFPKKLTKWLTYLMSLALVVGSYYAIDSIVHELIESFK